jgi:hypothetical protein
VLRVVEVCYTFETGQTGARCPSRIAAVAVARMGWTWFIDPSSTHWNRIVPPIQTDVGEAALKTTHICKAPT